jgi:hypothetical protein
MRLLVAAIFLSSIMAQANECAEDEYDDKKRTV